MGLFSSLAGTVATFLQIGGPNGPGVNDNVGALEAKNFSNSAFVNMRGADPVGPNDFVTLEYFQANPPPANLGQLISQTRLQYWSGQPAIDASFSIGANCILVIGSNNLGVYQSATNLLQSCSRGTANTNVAGGTWLGSYDGSAATESYKNS